MLVVVFTTFSGCGGSNVTVKSENLCFDFEASHGGSSFLINTKVKSEGEMEFTVLSPSNIEGLSFSFSDSVVHAKFLELEKDFPIDNTDFGVLGKIYRAFSALPDAEIIKQGDNLTATVSVEDKEFTFTVTDLGIPIKLSFNDGEIEFKNIITE